ncbi:MAG: acyltransferase [Lachnospiraceae bacterium]|nr:acyltransferase [Lachnospiraceae bacterium]
MMGDKYSRQRWIDCAKAIAIIAVVVDHCNMRLYTNQVIAQASYFSVSLFVLLSGISTWISDTHAPMDFKKSIRKAGVLHLHYALATFLLTCYYTSFFDLKTYLNYLFSFSITAPYYYFVFFIQLVIISPVLLAWCKYCAKQKWTFLWHLIILVLLGLLSAVCIRYTYILPVYGGGQFLFGGTYIILYYMGIMLESMNIFKRRKTDKIIMLMISALAWICWLLGCYWDKFPFDQWMMPYWGVGINPPSIQLMVFAIITLFLLYALFSLLEGSSMKAFKGVVSFFSWMGKYTLYIFMYHYLVMDVVFPIVNGMNIWFVRIFLFVPMILLPAIAVALFKKIRETTIRGFK